MLQAAYAHAVHDLSAITMQEPVPMAPVSILRVLLCSFYRCGKACNCINLFFCGKFGTKTISG